MHIDWLGCFNFTGNEQIELSIYQTKVGLAAFPLQQFKLTFSTPKRDFESTIDSPDRDCLIDQVETQNTAVVGNGPQRLEGGQDFIIQSISVRKFCGCKN